MEPLSPNDVRSEGTKPRLTLTDQIVGVFTSPGEVFEDVRVNPKRTTSWLLPLILLIIIALVSQVVMFNDVRIQQQMRDLTSKQFDQAVAQGKMTSEQRDRVEEYTSPTSGIATAIRMISTLILLPIMFFIVVLVWFLGGKIFFKSPVTYQKTMEVVGLTYCIVILESIVTLILVLAIGSLNATPSAAIVLSSFDPTDKIQILLSHLNVFTIWYLLVLGVGLSKVFERTTGAVLGMVFGLWVLYVGLTTALGIRLG